MTFKSITAVAAIALFATTAHANPPSPLIGLWLEINGPGVAVIGPCPNGADRLCAMGMKPRNGVPRTETGLVLTNVTASGSNRWSGNYRDGKRELPATLKFVTRDVVEMKVCIFILCQTARYTRSN